MGDEFANETLCVPCQRLVDLIVTSKHFYEESRASRSFPLLETSESLEDRARAACKICLKLLSLFDDSDRILIQFQVCRNNASCKYELAITRDKSLKRRMWICFSVRSPLLEDWYDGTDLALDRSIELICERCDDSNKAAGEEQWHDCLLKRQSQPRVDNRIPFGSIGQGNTKLSGVELKGSIIAKVSLSDKKLQSNEVPDEINKAAAKNTSLGVTDGDILLDDQFRHSAICNGCLEEIYGIRHKCLDCANFDFCNACFVEASLTHPHHRFASLHKSKTETLELRDYQETFTTIKQWLHVCKNTHTSCSINMKTDSENFFPTRLIDVGTVTPPKPRLVMGVTLPKDASYITLSHCWGSTMQIQLKLENFDQFSQELPFQELSKTFQDTIVATQRLGQRYLWIDSLCIIQDSQEDWQTQANSMAHVYSKSYCTIAAPTNGLFSSRRLGEIRMVRLRLESNGNIYKLQDSRYCVREGEHHPLAARAWVFQERLLSPCNIYFLRDQVFFECSSMNATEVFPHGEPFDAKFRRTKAELAVLIRSLPSEYSIKLVAAWEDLVKEYCEKSLSHLTDALTAIGGLAAVIQPHIRGGEYLAGLWKNHLFRELCWQVPTHFSRSNWQSRYVENPRPYIAPSWSWASVYAGPTGVSFPHERLGACSKEVAEFISHGVKLVDQKNLFGSVIPGSSLLMRGSLARIGNFTRYNRTLVHPWQFQFAGSHSNLGQSSTTPDGDAIFDFGEPHITNTEYFVLPLIVTPSFLSCWELYSSKLMLEEDVRDAGLKSLEGHRVCGIVLAATTDTGSYRRWGSFTTWNVTALHRAIQEFDLAADSSGLEYIRNGKLGFYYTLKLV